jgi:hypothetical protein
VIGLTNDLYACSLTEVEPMFRLRPRKPRVLFDAIAYLVIKSNSDALTLQRDLDKLAQWEQLWKMAFHPDKCNVLTISRNKTPKKFKYCLHDHVLESVDKVNNMGVTISDDLKWESHINNICGKANKTLGFLRIKEIISLLKGVINKLINTNYLNLLGLDFLQT